MLGLVTYNNLKMTLEKKLVLILLIQKAYLGSHISLEPRVLGWLEAEVGLESGSADSRLPHSPSPRGQSFFLQEMPKCRNSPATDYLPSRSFSPPYL